MLPSRPSIALAIAAALLPATAAAQLKAPAAPPPAAATPTATLLSLTPDAGSRGMVVTLNGPRSGEATAVRFGEWEGTILARSAAGVQVVVPQAPAEAHAVTVVFPAGAVRLQRPFDVYQAPTPRPTEVVIPPCSASSKALPAGTLTGVAPLTVARGGTLTLTGTGLGSYDRLRFPVVVAIPPPGQAPDRGRRAYEAELRHGLMGGATTVVVPRDAISGRIALVQHNPVVQACFTTDVHVTVEP